MVQGLKTGMYYLRTKAAASAIQFTVDKSKLRVKATSAEGEDLNEEEGVKGEDPLLDEQMSALACSLINREACDMCSS